MIVDGALRKSCVGRTSVSLVRWVDVLPESGEVSTASSILEGNHSSPPPVLAALGCSASFPQMNPIISICSAIPRPSLVIRRAWRHRSFGVVLDLSMMILSRRCFVARAS